MIGGARPEVAGQGNVGAGDLRLIKKHVGAVECREVQIAVVYLSRQKAVIAGSGQECSADGVVRLGELADGRLGRPVVFGEGNRVPAGDVGNFTCGLRKEAVGLIELRMQRDVLVLASQFVQYHFSA